MNPESIERIKDLLPTSLGSDEIREQIAADILRRSVFSARMASVPYLAKIREVCAEISAGRLDQSSARNTLETMLEQMGHSMQYEGGLKNPASIRRLNLILDTQTQMASSVNTLMQQTDATLAAWPAWELKRIEPRSQPRADWAARWNNAGAFVGWQGALKTSVGGRMIALKSSPIWQALGDGVGGFKDTLRNPYPPFAYSSGLDWVEVTAEECERLGLAATSSKSPYQAGSDGRAVSMKPPSPDQAGSDGRAVSMNPPSLSPSEADIADALKRYGFDLSKGLI